MSKEETVEENNLPLRAEMVGSTLSITIGEGIFASDLGEDGEIGVIFDLSVLRRIRGVD